MALGKKTGGRQRGTPNRRTQDVRLILERLGCDPIEGMARIAMDPQNPVEVRARMFAELAGYVAPKRKALEMAGTDANRVTFNIGIGTTQRPIQFTPTQPRATDARFAGNALE